MPERDGSPTEAEWLEGRYPGAQEEHEAREAQHATCSGCGRQGDPDEVDSAGRCPNCAIALKPNQEPS